MQMDSEENENSISEDVSIAGTTNNLLQQKRNKTKIKPNWSCGLRVCYFHISICEYEKSCI